MGSFAQFNLSKEMVLALEKLGYKEPSPVQGRVIPKALKGDSILCQSETGSGKTHSYLVPIIDRLDLSLPRLQSIVICPSLMAGSFRIVWNAFCSEPKISSSTFCSR